MDVPLHSIDFALRSGLVTLMLFVAAVLWRDQRTPSCRPGALVAVGVAAYALQSSAGFMGWPPLARAPVAMLSTGNALMFWLFARSLFDDEFRARPWHLAGWLALAGLALIGCVFGPRPWLGLTITGVTLGFSVLAVAQTLASWRADLVERRRRLRVFIVGAGSFYTALQMGQRLWSAEPAGPLAALADMAMLSAIGLVVAWRLVGVPSGGLVGRPNASATPAPNTRPPAEAGVVSEPPVDPALIVALERLMAEERVYREEGLTIARLAERLAVPEYKLRRAINQGLGYRNFNVFLNRYRLDEVKAALADPAQAPVPVLTIALDAGFQSLGPFNRAFKAETGQTPTEFRKAALA
jgi:AraC-like DNA-binding protein